MEIDQKLIQAEHFQTICQILSISATVHLQWKSIRKNDTRGIHWGIEVKNNGVIWVCLGNCELRERA